MVKFLRHQDHEIREYTTALFVNLINDPDHRSYISTTTAISDLTGCLRDESAEVRKNAARALGNLAVTYELMGNKDKSEEYRDKVRELTRQ